MQINLLNAEMQRTDEVTNIQPFAHFMIGCCKRIPARFEINIVSLAMCIRAWSAVVAIKDVPALHYYTV